MKNEDCIFCKIVNGDSPSHKVWEDEKHIAFLSIFPNTEGVSVVIPKKHYTSYFVDLPEKVLNELVLASKKVAKLLDESLDDVGKTSLVFEGFGVDHIHVKLFPMHGTSNMNEWKEIKSNLDKYFDKYEGYISSHDCKKEDDKKLEKLAENIKKHVK